LLSSNSSELNLELHTIIAAMMGGKRGMRAYRNGVLSMTKMRTAADRLRTRRRPGHGIEPHDILDVAPKVT
jgi:hypothetical protein